MDKLTIALLFLGLFPALWLVTLIGAAHLKHEKRQLLQKLKDSEYSLQCAKDYEATITKHLAVKKQLSDDMEESHMRLLQKIVAGENFSCESCQCNSEMCRLYLNDETEVEPK